ncbi:MAG: SGNH/GDSL hydrolase family protein [Ignavibacteriaceae bacterium]|nr:SGNH/GDSL hydrolase family protein [Ignavibacteriaceae bacterium]HMN23681.1 SGNH/GDSL hydrolase family protein [Ignavibacteriaceae bacterium]HRN26856.1 SGNH/GDSL hydrolase family protein [Ignavibacteriaceae bacterium]HRP92793.1 SGNH/GDSL hydrolase family protein [Ignavibacteriaceae bacterium]HRQ54474.1 SGNH/GDSL hydrolase family protein [Ignavibacteriaceae bacterium]
MKIFNLMILIILFLLFMDQSIQAQINDWANLNRYKEENLKIGLSDAGENRIVFMGNSITEGWKTLNPAFFSNSGYINRGISGQTTPQMLVRFRPDVVNLKPKVVVILAGTNDIAGNTGPSTLEMIEDNIKSMIEIANANNIKVIVCSVLPVFDYPWKPGLNPAQKIIDLNNWIKEYAFKNNIVYVDYFTPMADERNGLKKEYSEDGVHPNLAGYKLMEPLVVKAIEETL